MPVPKSVTKIDRKGNVTFTSNVDAVQYTLEELTRGALRDVGKFVAKQFRLSFYSHFKKIDGSVGRGAGYYVWRKNTHVEIGIGRNLRSGQKVGVSGIWQEIGSALTGEKKLGLLRQATMNNIPKIIEIESQYLSELSKDKPNLSGLSEEDYNDE